MHAPALDPALGAALRAGLALLLGTAALHKGRDPAAFRAALAAYGVLPAAAVPAGAALVLAAEAAAAVALLAGVLGAGGPALLAAGPLLAALLLGLYGAAIGWNLTRGRRELDCGCLGPAARQPLSGWLVGRNALLVAAALACLLPLAARTLVWLDAVSVVGATALAVLVWTGAHQALANHLENGGLARGNGGVAHAANGALAHAGSGLPRASDGLVRGAGGAVLR